MPRPSSSTKRISAIGQGTTVTSTGGIGPTLPGNVGVTLARPGRKPRIRTWIESITVALTIVESETVHEYCCGSGALLHPQAAPAMANVDAPTLMVVASGMLGRR